MQSLYVPLEIADGPRVARREMSGGTAAAAQFPCSDNATPRSAGPGRLLFRGRPGRPARFRQGRQLTQEVQTCSKGNRRPRSKR